MYEVFIHSQLYFDIGYGMSEEACFFCYVENEVPVKVPTDFFECVSGVCVNMNKANFNSSFSVSVFH